MFEITVDYDWWHNHYVEGQDHLKTGWAVLLKAKFQEHKPRSCGCELSVKTNRVVPRKSRKFNNNSFTGEFYCRFRKLGCSREYKFKVKGFPQSKNKKIAIFVERTGKRGTDCHIQGENISEENVAEGNVAEGNILAEEITPAAEIIPGENIQGEDSKTLGPNSDLLNLEVDTQSQDTSSPLIWTNHNGDNLFYCTINGQECVKDLQTLAEEGAFMIEPVEDISSNALVAEGTEIGKEGVAGGVFTTAASPEHLDGLKTEFDHEVHDSQDGASSVSLWDNIDGSTFVHNIQENYYVHKDLHTHINDDATSPNVPTNKNNPVIEQVLEPQPQEVEVASNVTCELSVPNVETTLEVHLTSDVPFMFPRIPDKYVGYFKEKLPIYDTDLEGGGKKSLDAAKVLSFEVSLIHNVSMGLPYKERLSQNKLFYDAWLVPTQVERNHFVLMVVLMRKKVILILDSLNRNVSNATVERVKMVLHLMSQCFGHDINLKEWSIHAPTDVIQQKNVTDCGVFVCMLAHTLCAGGTLLKKSPDLESVSRLRNWIATVLLDNLSQSPEIRTFNAIEKDCVKDLYKDFDQKHTAGDIEIEMPWEDSKLSSMKITRSTVDHRHTLDYLASFRALQPEPNVELHMAV
ncbi:Ubiquitin-like-specific protease 1 [Frankliniella fusca]|uniref:Ubiquitin-like-specific protease 1 n=1 Tax=Frankliniella fusca TaxID=407009 RepID=A0AAE1HCP0_9NEOP|nr:Ubiquitin-like-specific protease 1 [Frankliniella fusca]